MLRGLGTTLALAAGLVAGGRGMAQEPKLEPSRAAQPAKAGEGQRVDPGLDQKINQAREEIELLDLQLGTRKAQLLLAGARLAEARRWSELFHKLYRDGFASEERQLASRDDVLMHESRVTSEKAGVQEAELRVKQAKRRLDYGEFPPVPHESRIAELEQRLGGLERCLDLLHQEIGNLRRMIRPEWKIPENVERPPVNRIRPPQ